MRMYRFRMRMQRRLTRPIVNLVQRVIPTDAGDDLMRALAAERRFVGLVANGETGLIRGSLNDRNVFGVYAATGKWGSRTTDLFRGFFAEGPGMFLDIGANIGLTLIPIARNPKVRCVAFEPEPINFGHLKANIAENCPHGNVELHQMALFTERGSLDIELDETENPGDHRIRLAGRAAPGRFGEERRRVISVEGAPLDEVVRREGGPLAVKIDTQGAEPFVIAGGRKTLSAADLVVMEWGPYLLRRLGGDPGLVADFVCSSFSSLSIGGGEREPFGSPMPIAQGAEWLRAVAASHADDHLAYWDVVLRK